ncbi:MAG: hypothetical protein J6K84_05110 [Oscillospiraceae bacterium]|nr:hypothetical protein [Oscillospiraceae bacterium]
MTPCTLYGRLPEHYGLSHILELSQKAAGTHLEQLGLSGKAEEMGLAWMIIRIHGEILRPLQDELKISTWPMESKRGFLPRYCEMHDSEGNLCLKMTTLWVLADATTRTLRMDEPILVPNMARGDELPPARSLPKKTLPQLGAFTVTDDQIDENGHMNNCQYATLAQPYFPVDTLHQFTVDYRAEILPHAHGELWGAWEDDAFFFCGTCEEKEHFRMKLTFHKEVQA